ncbi:uncharacterized protein N7484_005933 [Penicillium longicatenatum]|uniref:uncharacterized protein n=1 Tax=Penicillium longicatenatum TaxID=1561947 RepID=UPI002547182E|nr:uncharacterized protein N7484_005933 [Penicillium longicatenatum]KAJ5643426.1 hypothetical protein N7484_005933 [Penicillium longicatenatum]
MAMSLLRAVVSVAALLLSSFISCVALNVSQPYRIHFLLPILVPAALAFHTINDINLALPGLGLGIVWGHATTIHVTNIISVLYIERWVLHPTTHPKPWDLHAAYKIWSNPQLLHTHRAVPGARMMPTRPSRTEFLTRRLFGLLVLFLVARYMMAPLLPGAFEPLTVTDFSVTKQSYIRRVIMGSEITVRETLLRCVLAVHWIWSNNAALHLFHTVVAILFSCVLRWDEPWEWPLLFGNPAEAYTIRYFWSRFWHRLVYRPYKNYGLWVSRRVFHLPRGGTGEKITVLSLVFLLSGVVHSLISWQMGRCEAWRDTLWFFMNAIAAMVEMVAISCWTAYIERNKMLIEWSRVAEKWGVYKAIGFLWVFGFMFWSVPKWHYGKIYCAANRL